MGVECGNARLARRVAHHPAVAAYGVPAVMRKDDLFDGVVDALEDLDNPRLILDELASNTLAAGVQASVAVTVAGQITLRSSA
jgi:hypothetical protein